MASDEKRKDRPEDQPMPVASDSPSMHDIASTLLGARKSLGARRYGQPLQAFNGRDAVKDAMEEALDGVAYMAQVLWEQSNPARTYVGAIIHALVVCQHTGEKPVVDFQGQFVPSSVTALLTQLEIEWR